MAPSIRPFASGDLTTLHTIRTAAFAPIFRSFRDALGPQLSALALTTAETEQRDLLDAICKPGSPHHVFVVEIDGSIAGFLTYVLNQDKRGEITLNAVHPDHAGKGLGTMLYVFALEQMKLAGMTYATVGTGGDPSHAPARRAYEKAGFTLGLPSIYLYSPL